VRCVNSSHVANVCGNKLLTSQALIRDGVPSPRVKVAFTPESDTPPRGRGRYVAAPDYSPFRAQEEFSPMAGDPVIWAQLDGTGLHVYSFVILDNGRYEIQIYTRSLTEDGLTLHFERIVDGEVIRRIEGHAVRAR